MTCGDPAFSVNINDMRKILFAGIFAAAASVVSLIGAGCASETRQITSASPQTKPNFKSEISKNPNIPDAAKKAFGNH
jgi:hypothetical protein